MTDSVVCSLLERMRPRSGMYIYEPSVRFLRLYIEGYLMGAHDFRGISRDDKYDGFGAWVERRYGVEATIGWPARVCK